MFALNVLSEQFILVDDVIKGVILCFFNILLFIYRYDGSFLKMLNRVKVSNLEVNICRNHPSKSKPRASPPLTLNLQQFWLIAMDVVYELDRATLLSHAANFPQWPLTVLLFEQFLHIGALCLLVELVT